MKSVKMLISSAVICLFYHTGLGQRSTATAFVDVSSKHVNAVTDRNASGKPEVAPNAVEFKMYNKAIRNFKKKQPGIENEKWEILEEGTIIQDKYLPNIVRYVVRFTKDQKKMMITYDKRGTLVYKLCTYKEIHLPKEIRHIVRSTYYDYKITTVHEVHMPTNRYPIYVVHVEDQNEIIHLRINDGEMQEIRSFDK